MTITTQLPPTPAETKVLQTLLHSDPAWWLENYFWVEDPRDPITGEEFEPGPIRLADHQKKILRHALTKVNGRFPYSTIVFSTIKKSGKTRLAAGVASWFAATQSPYNEIYCLANDGKQSSDRILSAVNKFVSISPEVNWRLTKTRITVPNGTFLEAIPCDPTGQAGANPGLTVWSEMWGYRHEHKERLWTEMTVPPTRYGKAFRWVESYAGFEGESTVLENLYETGVNNGIRHPAFPVVPVYVNQRARMFCYWDEGEAARRMPWQISEYYAEEAQLLTYHEFERVHMNKWQRPLDKAIPIEWWDRLVDVQRDGHALPPVEPTEPMVFAADASLTHDCCALVGVSRHPVRRDETAVRYARIWTPPRGGYIDLGETLEVAIMEAIRDYNVIEVAYDKYQLHKMMTDIRKLGVVRTFQFEQASRRALADKQLVDKIIRKEITHRGSQILRKHVDNAAAKADGRTYRFVKMNKDLKDDVTARPIDGLVALSMADYEASRLNIG
jgi:phage terminase large subunit-like protein